MGKLKEDEIYQCGLTFIIIIETIGALTLICSFTNVDLKKKSLICLINKSIQWFNNIIVACFITRVRAIYILEWSSVIKPISSCLCNSLHYTFSQSNTNKCKIRKLLSYNLFNSQFNGQPNMPQGRFYIRKHESASTSIDPSYPCVIIMYYKDIKGLKKYYTRDGARQTKLRVIF